VGLIPSQSPLISEFRDFPPQSCEKFFAPVVGHEKISAVGLVPFVFCSRFVFSIYKGFSLGD
jgi:hypothetical protein